MHRFLLLLLAVFGLTSAVRADEARTVAASLIVKFEGCPSRTYLDRTVVAGGYGHQLPGRKVGELVTTSQAQAWLVEDLASSQAVVRRYVSRAMTPSQEGALISLAYNIGEAQFRASTAVRRFNAGNQVGAAEALTWFNKSGGLVLKGLVRRRAAEQATFLAGTYVPTGKAIAKR